MSCEVACCSSAMATGLISPKPPSLAGNASISRARWPGEGCPVSAGMKCDCITNSSGWRRSEDESFPSQYLGEGSSTLNKGHE